MSKLKKYLNIVNGINENNYSYYDDDDDEARADKIFGQKIGINGKRFSDEEKKIINLIIKYADIFNKNSFDFDKEKLIEYTVFISQVDDFYKNEYKRFILKIKKIDKEDSKTIKNYFVKEGVLKVLKKITKQEEAIKLIDQYVDLLNKNNSSFDKEKLHMYIKFPSQIEFNKLIDKMKTIDKSDAYVLGKYLKSQKLI
jgi:hypothetical protein